MTNRYKQEQELMLAKIIENGNGAMRTLLGAHGQRAGPTQTSWLAQQRKSVRFLTLLGLQTGLTSMTHSNSSRFLRGKRHLHTPFSSSTPRERAASSVHSDTPFDLAIFTICYDQLMIMGIFCVEVLYRDAALRFRGSVANLCQMIATFSVRPSRTMWSVPDTCACLS